MTADEAAKVIKRIELEIDKTQQDIADYQQLTKPIAPDAAIGRISRMDAINNKSITEAALRQAQQKLTKLKAVLAKAGSSDFGKCARCKQPIPPGRIMFKPESTHCVACAR